MGTASPPMIWTVLSANPKHPPPGLILHSASFHEELHAYRFAYNMRLSGWGIVLVTEHEISATDQQAVRPETVSRAPVDIAPAS